MFCGTYGREVKTDGRDGFRVEPLDKKLHSCSRLSIDTTRIVPGHMCRAREEIVAGAGVSRQTEAESTEVVNFGCVLIKVKT